MQMRAAVQNTRVFQTLLLFASLFTSDIVSLQTQS